MPRTIRSPFTAPGEQGGKRWRAALEAFGVGVPLVLSELAVHEASAGFPLPVLLVLGIAVICLFVVRRRFPASSLLGVAALLSVLLSAGLPAAMVSYGAARQMVPSRRRMLVLFGSSVLLIVLSTGLAPLIGMGGHGYGLAMGSVFATTTIIVPGLVGTAAGQQDRLLEALKERAAAAEEARRLVDSESRTHERSRIAAEMHDLVGHRLSLISLHAGGLEMALGKQAPELRDEATVVRRATGDAMRELREVLGVLGPLSRDTGTAALTDTTGTRSDIEALAEESRQVGIPVDLGWDGPDLDSRSASVRRAVHRVVRECLTNVHRYATGARVAVTVRHTEERIDVQVRNGVPPKPPSASTGLGSGRGLPGLRERVGLLGGSLEAAPTAGGGFAVTALIPTEPDPNAATGDPDRPDGGNGSYDTAYEGGEQGAHLSGGRGFLDRFQRRFLAGLTGLLGLTGVGVMMLFGAVLVEEARVSNQPVAREDPRLGMTMDEVTESVYGDSAEVRAAATGSEPPRPDFVTSCIYPTVGTEELPDWEYRYSSEGAESETTHLRITRYCFRGERLADIERFIVPLVSRTPPWETP
ncbi:two-component sensor histidine kinase [Streptomyces sp. P38-E01]|uniref:histidine kinase n=1 Tax=Streptomyces tardus TaxID=2780544 RepID=A0A949JDJ0_9ACTN|nr:histidine kinase [Streptomyces tardus]MBU7597926.1 two-component sensor histidine kinase [Streptomyces tardus]